MTRPPTRWWWLAVGFLCVALVAGACSTGPGIASLRGNAGVLRVVAAENFWGSIAAQLGGRQVHVQNLIVNPNADPHSYEPTAADGRAIASADLVVVNGIGYDTWATRLVDANPVDGRIDLTVGDVLRVAAGANPHRWYNPGDVQRVVTTIVADYIKLEPARADYFRGREADFQNRALSTYRAAVAAIATQFAGTPIGASESIVAMLAPSVRLTLITPTDFLKAVSEGTEPTVVDKATADAQIRTHAIAVYVYNPQNATPDVQAQVAQAHAAGIPVTAMTETMVPPTATWEQWQTAQLISLRAALAAGTGR